MNLRKYSDIDQSNIIRRCTPNMPFNLIGRMKSDEVVKYGSVAVWAGCDFVEGVA